MPSAMPEPSSLALLIREAVALTEELNHRRWPHARHRTHTIAARAGNRPVVRRAAVAHLEVIDADLHPADARWGPLLADLHRAIDAALDDAAPIGLR